MRKSKAAIALLLAVILLVMGAPTGYAQFGRREAFTQNYNDTTVKRMPRCINRNASFEAFRWSEAGGLSADGEPLESQIRDHENDIPTLLLSGPVTVTPREDARVVDGVLKVFDMSLLPVIEYPEGEGLACLQALAPGEYWCAVVVEVSHDGSASGYDCVFRLEVTATPVSAGAENVPDDILKALHAIPPGADPEIAATYPVVVTDTEMHIYNVSLWDDFYASARAGEPADVTIALYTGYQQALLYFIRYDGSSYLLVRDTTREKLLGSASPDYDTDTFANLQVLSWEGNQFAVLSDKPYSGYKEYYESMYTETEHPALCVMLWKDVATQKQGDTIPVTKQLLLKFIDDEIAMYEAQRYQHKDKPEDAALVEELDGKLNELRTYRDLAAENATEGNVTFYWDRFWLQIMEQPLPEGYGSFPKAD